jgi:hypothetical protein
MTLLVLGYSRGLIPHGLVDRYQRVRKTVTFLHSEDGGRNLLRDVGACLSDYTASDPRKYFAYSYVYCFLISLVPRAPYKISLFVRTPFLELSRVAVTFKFER